MTGETIVLGPLDASPAGEWPYWEGGDGPDKQGQCTLCCRRCVLDNGQTGTCGTRRNEGGALAVRDYSVVTTMTRQMHGIADPFHVLRDAQGGTRWRTRNPTATMRG